MTKKQQKRSFAGFLGANEGDRPSAPENDTLPAITGTAQVGEVLTTTPGAWDGVASPVVSRQWKKAGAAIAGATGTTYTPVEGDIGAKISVTETATNWKGKASATSLETAAVIAAEEEAP
ncbi:MAG: hypothetical protein AB7E55_24755 [Pigmentiphaga sp.]